jgi:hypothetical protein
MVDKSRRGKFGARLAYAQVMSKTPSSYVSDLRYRAAKEVADKRGV